MRKMQANVSNVRKDNAINGGAAPGSRVSRRFGLTFCVSKSWQIDRHGSWGIWCCSVDVMVRPGGYMPRTTPGHPCSVIRAWRLLRRVYVARRCRRNQVGEKMELPIVARKVGSGT